MQVADLVVVAGATERARVPQCIQQAGAVGALVCDGRLVVDAAFRTSHPNIFAAGTVATFSRRSTLFVSFLILATSAVPCLVVDLLLLLLLLLLMLLLLLHALP